MKKFLIIIYVIMVFSQTNAAYNFKCITVLPQGVDVASFCIDAGDTDHNGSNELIFWTYGPEWGLVIYEYRPENLYGRVFRDTSFIFDFGGICDIDKDNLTDLAVTTDRGGVWFNWVQTRESPTYNDYPSVVTWEAKRDSIQYMDISLLTDFDRDGKNELWTHPVGYLDVYENIGDNRNELVLSKCIGLASGFPCDDFDGDGKLEFASWGYVVDDSFRLTYVVHTFENTGDNEYEETWRDTVGGELSNGHDLCSGKDCDGDGKPEFFVNFDNPIGRNVSVAFMGCLVQYEATGNNIYKRVVLDSFSHAGSTISRQSDCGDVDGDGIEEIVWSLGTDVIVLKATGNDQYERVWQWKNDLGGDNQSARVLCYDLNKNGYDEIVLSGEGKTNIYEIDTPSIQEAQSQLGKPFITNLYQNYPNPFTYQTTIKYQVAGIADRVSLRIYDVSGRSVKQFNNLTNQPFNQITWDGRDDRGCLVPSGIYFCELVTTNQVHTQRLTKKIVLQR